MPQIVRVEREVRAPADLLWALVSDVTRMGEWSPETRGCRWLGGATGPALGARFRGRNSYRGRWWVTTCTVVGCEPGSSFAFEVTAGPLPVAHWAYSFEPAAGGCRVTETFTDLRARAFAVLGNVFLGVADRAAHNRSTMEETLHRLAEAAESATAAR